MKLSKKVKTEHTILDEFIPFLCPEQEEGIQRIIPWRIMRQQKGSSMLRFSPYPFTSTGWKAKMSKGATSQELFIIVGDQDLVDKKYLQDRREAFISTR